MIVNRGPPQPLPVNLWLTAATVGHSLGTDKTREQYGLSLASMSLDVSRGSLKHMPGVALQFTPGYFLRSFSTKAFSSSGDIVKPALASYEALLLARSWASCGPTAVGSLAGADAAGTAPAWKPGTDGGAA